MVVVIGTFFTVVVLTLCATALAVERSPFRASAHQAPILVGLVGVVVVYSLVANTTVLDRLFYTQDLERAVGVPLGSVFSTDAFQPMAGSGTLYVVLLWTLSHLGTGTAVFFTFIGITSSVIYLWPLVKLLAWWKATYIFFLALALSTFTSYTSIVAKQSMAMAMLSAALCWAFVGRRRNLALAFTFAACLIHWSAIPFALVLLVVVLFHVTIRLALTAWGISALLFLTNAQSLLLGGLVAHIPKFTEYTSSTLASVYTSGANRRDFFAAGLLMLMVFLALRRSLDLPEWYTRVLVVFVGYNTIFLLGGFVFYSDRLAAYSWYLAPLLAAAPVLGLATSTAKALSVVVVVAAAAAALFLFRGPFALSSPLWALS